jgi:hypothetical protein
MKRILVFALAAISFTACDNKKTDETTISSSDSATTTSDVMADNTTVANTYIPAEGDVMYRDGRLMVWRSNAYVVADNDVNQDNGIVVRRNGEVVREGKVIRLQEGEAVTKTGRFFNKAGEAIEDAWDATKKGVSKAADAVGKGAEKVGDKVKDAVD